MKKFMNLLMVFFILTQNIALASVTPVNAPTASWSTRVTVPICDAWIIVAQDATTVTTNPYQPGYTWDSSTAYKTPIKVGGFGGCVLGAKYANGQSFSTNIVACIWGYKGGEWSPLRLTGSNTQAIITISTSSTDSISTDSKTRRTVNSVQIDTDGSSSIAVTISTPCVVTGTAEDEPSSGLVELDLSLI